MSALHNLRDSHQGSLDEKICTKDLIKIYVTVNFQRLFRWCDQSFGVLDFNSVFCKYVLFLLTIVINKTWKLIDSLGPTSQKFLMLSVFPGFH